SNTPPTPQTYTLSLHDALPISAPRDRSGCLASREGRGAARRHHVDRPAAETRGAGVGRAKNQGSSSRIPCSLFPVLVPCSFKSGDRKSTRLNSSHSQISYAVFC